MNDEKNLDALFLKVGLLKLTIVEPNLLETEFLQVLLKYFIYWVRRYANLCGGKYKTHSPSPKRIEIWLRRQTDPQKIIPGEFQAKYKESLEF